MYTLSIPNETFTVPTLAGVIALFTNERVKGTETSSISLRSEGLAASVTRYNGTLAIRCAGTAAEIVARLFDEVHAFWLSAYGEQARPWQIRPTHWNELFALFELARAPQSFLSTDQVDAEKVAAREARQFFNLSSLFHEAAIARFGFGAGGPPVAGGQVNGRHEVHVAYALLRNEDVPVAVLNDYRAMERPFRHDLEWAELLLSVPEIRGQLPAGRMQRVSSVMRHAKQSITAGNIDAIVAATAGLPETAGYIEVEDALFDAQILRAEPLPPMFDKPVAIGQPLNDFAARLRQLLADSRRDRALDRADMERAQGRMSARRHKLECEMALLSHGRETHDWPNRVAAAVDQRDVAMILDLLDTPDDHNRTSKQVVEEFHGVKLRGMKAKARRRALFAFCGLDEPAQAAWEKADAGRKLEARREDEAKRAKEAALTARYKRNDGEIIDGVTHVDEAIASGFSEIRNWRVGAILQYALVNPALNQGRRLQAKDGTLAYARTVLERRAA
ncbi:hypothetical protein EN871_28960 [bacterium M00.F.Ca.ET.228.01.1.1]|nr:hypothetical protein EN871_28960 [bacterium M00.F.Ca.ET.228.01.1.1]TGR96488.1 hypothetical protein EN834_28010 [bacterium M00.F.Ca.ET.191.01.1.1]TGT97724.1 hypothetical protein EN798_28015 [bacterium M00.F.Ca.ET.155.01.1.1]